MPVKVSIFCDELPFGYNGICYPFTIGGSTRIICYAFLSVSLIDLEPLVWMSEANSILTHPISYPSVGKYNLFVFWNFLGLLCRLLFLENFALRLEHLSRQASFQSSTNVNKPIKKSVSHIENSCLSFTYSFPSKHFNVVSTLPFGRYDVATSHDVKSTLNNVESTLSILMLI